MTDNTIKDISITCPECCKTIKIISGEMVGYICDNCGSEYYVVNKNG